MLIVILFAHQTRQAKKTFLPNPISFEFHNVRNAIRKVQQVLAKTQPQLLSDR